MSDTPHSAPRITADDVAQYRRQVEDAAAHVRDRIDAVPSTALVLGTGLGALADDLEVDASFPYEDLPHVPVSTVDTHDGRLAVGSLNGTPVVVMQGRMHLYEGYTARQVTFPIRVLAALGIDVLLVSNAAGAVNPQFRTSDLMLITDHINFQGANPLVGPNVDDWGPRFPDMSEPYDVDLRECAQEVALREGIRLQRGVYLAVLGPNLETKAEYRMVRTMGADVVGMSTVPEVIAARHMGVRVMAVSVVTDMGLPDALEPVSLDDVLAAAEKAGPALTRLVEGVVAELDA